MVETLTILDDSRNPARGGLVEKKSEFIAEACHVDSLQEAMAFVERIRERHPKARHVAYAAICGSADGNQGERMSDDGEPSGTAGKPILDVLRNTAVTDCAVTVTRYFGGVLLGSGGLIRAYASAASSALATAAMGHVIACRRYRIRLAYAQLGVLDHVLAKFGGERSNERFTDHITCEASVTIDRADGFENLLRELTNDRVRPEASGVTNRVEPLP